MDINVWEIALYIINIVILFLFLRWLLYKPVMRFMNKRTDGIKQQLDDAAQKQTDAEDVKKKYDDMMDNAKQLAADIIEKGKTTADGQAQQIVVEAESQASDIASRSKRYVEEQKKQAVVDMRQEITNMAIQIAEKILEREVSIDDNKDIINRFFEKVG